MWMNENLTLGISGHLINYYFLKKIQKKKKRRKTKRQKDKKMGVAWPSPSGQMGVVSHPLGSATPMEPRGWSKPPLMRATPGTHWWWVSHPLVPKGVANFYFFFLVFLSLYIYILFK
jgi:hypothetical protein